jgi:hypothetical protein
LNCFRIRHAVSRYARNVPPLLPIAGVLTAGVFVAVGTWVQNSVQSKALRYLLYVGVFTAFLVVVYAGNLILIMLSDSPELQTRMKLRWKRFLEIGESPELFGPAHDLPDRVASLVVWWHWWRIMR